MIVAATRRDQLSVAARVRQIEPQLDALVLSARQLELTTEEVLAQLPDDVLAKPAPPVGTLDAVEAHRHVARIRVVLRVGEVLREDLDDRGEHEADRDRDRPGGNLRRIRAGEKLDPFKLGEGPVPLPIGQKKEEVKQQQGDPQVAARRRQIQRQMALHRLSTTIPKADVIVTNPTHYAVALQYDYEKMAAPVVIAKGINFLNVFICFHIHYCNSINAINAVKEPFI